MKYLTVIPVYNEEETIQAVVEGALSYGPVCVINDASTDRTVEILSEIKERFSKNLHIIHHPQNTHISKALRDGMEFAHKHNVDYIVTMDAGLSHSHKALPDFFSHPHCDLLIGSRRKPTNVPFYRRIVSRGAAIAVNYCLSESLFNFFGPRIKDCTSGFRRYSRASIELLLNSKLQSIAHEFNMEALYLIHTASLSVAELAITYRFSNSSFNSKILKRAVRFALHLFMDKLKRLSPAREASLRT